MRAIGSNQAIGGVQLPGAVVRREGRAGDLHVPSFARIVA